jgi:hypothetical protein
MKIRMQAILAKWVGYQVDAAMARDAESDRKEVTFTVLAEFVRSGDAERYVRRDGRIGWRATSGFLEKLREGQMEAEEA